VAQGWLRLHTNEDVRLVIDKKSCLRTKKVKEAKGGLYYTPYFDQ